MLRAAQVTTPAQMRLSHPVATHAGVVTPREAAESDTVVVVDQSEELLTLRSDPAERAVFIGLLATTQSTLRHRSLWTLRAASFVRGPLIRSTLLAG